MNIPKHQPVKTRPAFLSVTVVSSCVLKKNSHLMLGKPKTGFYDEVNKFHLRGSIFRVEIPGILHFIIGQNHVDL